MPLTTFDGVQTQALPHGSSVYVTGDDITLQVASQPAGREGRVGRTAWPLLGVRGVAWRGVALLGVSRPRWCQLTLLSLISKLAAFERVDSLSSCRRRTTAARPCCTWLYLDGVVTSGGRWARALPVLGASGWPQGKTGKTEDR